jgi:hypothetical protein
MWKLFRLFNWHLKMPAVFILRKENVMSGGLFETAAAMIFHFFFGRLHEK